MDRRRPRNPPPRPLVLLVEAHEDTRAVYALALRTTGFDVVAVADGTEAYRHAWELHPDIILTHLPTPACVGWQFLQDLSQDARTRDIPVAFFPKPCLPDQLPAGLREVLGRKAGTHVER